MKKVEKILSSMKVDKKNKIKLSKFATDATPGVKDKDEARELLAKSTEELDELQYKLYAESKTALLVVFQAMDTAGKDGVIRKVFGPINPQGARVTSFKRPTEKELARDFLWRIHLAVPAKGMIGIFNRSHYEDVLVRKVHKMDPREVLEARYAQINAFEKYLGDNDVAIVKFYLHISKKEQRERLQARLDNPKKRWKFEMADLEERKLWDKYQDAYQTALDKCSAEHAPWYVIPADNKWYRDWAVSSIIVRELKRIDPKFPKEQEGLDGVTVE